MGLCGGLKARVKEAIGEVGVFLQISADRETGMYQRTDG